MRLDRNFGIFGIVLDDLVNFLEPILLFFQVWSFEPPVLLVVVDPNDELVIFLRKDLAISDPEIDAPPVLLLLRLVFEIGELASRKHKISVLEPGEDAFAVLL